MAKAQRVNKIICKWHITKFQLKLKFFWGKQTKL